MTTNTTTLAGCIERIVALLATVAGGEGVDPTNRGVTLYAKYGPEYDALRRVVTCIDETDIDCAFECHRCPGITVEGAGFIWPHSRAAFWEAAEQCDPGALEGAITRATSELIRFDSTFLAFDDKWYTHYYTNQNGGWSLAIYLSSGVTRTEAVLQAVVAALEVV